MKIVTVYFDFPGSDRYKRLLDVMLFSAKSIGYDIDVIRIAPPDKIRHSRSIDANTAKLDVWYDYLNKQKKGEKIVFIDCDLLFLRPIDDAFSKHFDIAYTYRDSGVPLNGGVVFIRNNKYSRAFIQKWQQTNREFYDGHPAYAYYRRVYCGINQSAFGYLLDQDIDCHIEALPCTIYNACGDRWRNLHEDTRIIHIKDELRRAVLRERFAPWLDDVIALWDSAENSLIAQEGNLV